MILLNYDRIERDAKLANNVLKEKKKNIEKLKVISIDLSHNFCKPFDCCEESLMSLFDSSLKEHIATSVPFFLANVFFLSHLSHLEKLETLSKCQKTHTQNASYDIIKQMI